MLKMTILNELDLILLKEYFYKRNSRNFDAISDFISKLMDSDLEEVFDKLAETKKCKQSYAKYFQNKQEFFDKAIQLTRFDLEV